MKKKTKKEKKTVFDSFVLVQEGPSKTWISVCGDGFLLEQKMYEMKGRYSGNVYKIYSCEILLKD